MLTANSATSYADELIYSGFMTDHSQLEKITDGSADYGRRLQRRFDYAKLPAEQRSDCLAQ